MQELKRLIAEQPTTGVFDSTGVKIYGKGECKVRQRRKEKRRTWRKKPPRCFPNFHEIILNKPTESALIDYKATEQMIKKLLRSA